MAFFENLGTFFNPAEFAIPACYGPAEATVNVIFEAAFVERLGLAGTNPVALAEAADVADVQEGWILTVSGTPYTIRGIEPNGTGITLLQLERYPDNGFDRGFDAGFGD